MTENGLPFYEPKIRQINTFSADQVTKIKNIAGLVFFPQ